MQFYDKTDKYISLCVVRPPAINLLAITIRARLKQNQNNHRILVDHSLFLDIFEKYLWINEKLYQSLFVFYRKENINGKQQSNTTY